ncbi:hypothetical protein KI440_01500 [Candidatus Saccharibacteria bacterium TM7i]|nr:hypothetical protein KI440_01500 [Candidatus Saccharibacteria bacterium TM7i]
MGQNVTTTSIVVATILTAILIFNDFSAGTGLHTRAYIGITSLLCLLLISLLILKKHETLAHWLLIIFFSAIALVALYLWGINATPGLITIGFVVILTGALLGTKRMLIIVLSLCIGLILIQLIHHYGFYQPDIEHLTQQTSFLDVLAYITVIMSFSLTAWLSMRRSEYALRRARKAEKKLRTQKEVLKLQLAQESAKLRTNQLKEVQQLYSFATLGQNTAATLHELSNHLTILGMDIEGLQGSKKISEALAETQESFAQITAMVKTVRRQLDTYNSEQSIRPYSILKSTLNDIQIQFDARHTLLTCVVDQSLDKKIKARGDPLALRHILSILLKNGLEACSDFPEAQVCARISQTKALIRITISDNGIGIAPEILPNLFSPLASTKPSGLGAGLFIARNLAKTQLQSNLRLHSNGVIDEKRHHLRGATFTLEIPIKSRRAPTPRES